MDKAEQKDQMQIKSVWREAKQKEQRRGEKGQNAHDFRNDGK